MQRGWGRQHYHKKECTGEGEAGRFVHYRDRTETKRVAGNSTHAYPTQPPETMEVSGSMLPQRNMSLSLILEQHGSRLIFMAYAIAKAMQ